MPGAGGKFQSRLRTGLTPENPLSCGNEDAGRDKPPYHGKPQWHVSDRSGMAALPSPHFSRARNRKSSVEVHLTLNRSCHSDKAFGACCSANSEPAVHLTLSYLELGSFNFELSEAHISTGSR
jgi:hypothetical protein